MPKQYRYYDFVMVLFVTVLLLSNLLSSAKLIDIRVASFYVGNLEIALGKFDAGTLVFPISYIFGDILTEVYGYRRSRRVIWMGFLATALMGFFVWLAGVLPGDDILWGQQTAYDTILGSVSKLVIASLVAYWLGEFSNSYVLARMKVATKGRWLWSRTIGSTLVGQAVDTTVFFAVAALLGAFPIEVVPSLAVTNYVLKVGIEALFTPLTFRVVNFLKAAENEDHFDYNTRFNPFRLDI